MSPAGGSTSSARPDELHRYRAEVVRHHALAVRALREAEQAAAAYDATCQEVPLTHPPLAAAHEAVGHLRGLAARVGDVGDAFLLADRSPGGGLARVGDDRLARVVVDRFPGLANATILGTVADDLAADVADGLAEAALDGRTDLEGLRESVPAALAADPTFARAVLRELDPDRLAIVVDRLATDATPGHPTADLRWLGDLFALGAARSAHGGPTAATRALLDDADGRTAVRILRSSSSLRLPDATLQAIAVAVAISNPSSTDGGHPFLVDRRSRDTGDDPILLEAARVPGLALRLLTGEDPQRPIRGRLEELVATSSRASQRGLATLLDAARSDRGRVEAHGALSPAGLELLHGAVSALAGLPTAGLTTDGPSATLVGAATAVVTDDVDLAVAHTRLPDDAEERERRVEALTRALEHAAGDDESWSALVDGLDAGRAEATRISIETGDDAALALAARLDAILGAAAERADAPDRRLDPLLGRLADAVGGYVEHSFGPVGGAAASAGIHVAADAAADELAGDPGSAGERLRSHRAEAGRVLAVVDAFPDEVVWDGSGVSGPTQLAAAIAGDAIDGGDQVLEQWELAQGPTVHRELARLRAVYAAGADLSS